MAKIAYTKLALKQDASIKTIIINEQEIEVKQYLPLNDKLELISKVISQSIDEHNFANPMKIDLYTGLEIIYAYTNITFTDKQKEDFLKLYDTLVSSGILDKVFEAIPAVEFNRLMEGIHATAEAIYTYRNSVLGILEAISNDYSNLNIDVNGIAEKLQNPENLSFLRDVMTKLG